MDKLWWNHITKAHKFMEDIVMTAAQERSIILSLPLNVPWKNTLIELVEEQLKIDNPKNSFDYLKCPEGDIGLFLMNKYCKKERRESYRYGVSYASFLGRCEDIVLNDRYIWVYDIPAEKYSEWLDFIYEYNKNVTDKTPAIFILEIHDDVLANKTKKGIRKILFNQEIDSYDKFAFCALAATNNNIKDYMRPYFAELVSSVCSEDIELCAQCVVSGSEFLENPFDTIQSILSNKLRSDGEPYTFDKTKEEIEKLIWEAQLKNVFPMIEKYRWTFVKEYHDQIKKALPITTSSGEEVSTPEDVEIGALVYLVKNEFIRLDQRSYEELVKFRDARNKLAHLNLLDPDAVEELIHKMTYQKKG